MVVPAGISSLQLCEIGFPWPSERVPIPGHLLHATIMAFSHITLALTLQLCRVRGLLLSLSQAFSWYASEAYAQLDINFGICFAK